MTVYCLLLETNNGVSDVESDILVFSSLDGAKAEMAGIVSRESENVKEGGDDLDGVLYLEDDYFCFYAYQGGDWAYRGTIYHRDVNGEHK